VDSRQTDSQGHADDHEAGKRGRSGGSSATGMGGQESGSGTEGCGVFRESDEAGRSGTGRVGDG